MGEFDFAKGASDSAAAVRQVTAERCQRQIAYLKRKKETSAKELQPRKRHRKSALQWLVTVENQARSSLFLFSGVVS